MMREYADAPATFTDAPSSVGEALDNALDAGFDFGGDSLGGRRRHPGRGTRDGFTAKLQRFLEDLPDGMTVREIREHLGE
jgi:hypothetical protein